MNEMSSLIDSLIVADIDRATISTEMKTYPKIRDPHLSTHNCKLLFGCVCFVEFRLT